MKSLVIGYGQLGESLWNALARHAATQPGILEKPEYLARERVDVQDFSALFTEVNWFRPDMIFHTAALTKVNYCEEHPAEAFDVNGVGVANVVEAARSVNAQLVYFSTDYVFSGKAEGPILEDAAPEPLNVYGASKLAGEQPVADYDRGHIVRTSGVFGPRQDGSERNFFRAVYDKLSSSDDPLEVVDDQFTAVSYAPHLATMLFELLPAGLPPVVHLTSAGKHSWFGWARELALAGGFDPARIVPVPTDASSPVRRPRYSVLGSRFPAVNSIIGQYPGTKGIAAYVQLLQSRI